MNTTTPTTPFGQQTQAGNKKGKSQDNLGAQATVAGVSALGGGVAGWAANEVFADEPIPVDIVDEPGDTIETPAHTPAPAASSTAQPPQSTISGQQAGEIISGGQTGTTPGGISTGGPSTGGPSTGGGGGTSTGGNVTGNGETTVNPGDIEINVEEIDVSTDAEADAIIAEEQIDPGDINVGDKVVFDNVGTVYTLDGESYSAATFHFEGEEEQFVMVDVDGDEVFDIITDENFTVEVETPYDFTYGDAEQQISADNPEYLAAAETEVDLPEDVDYTDDIILT